VAQKLVHQLERAALGVCACFAVELEQRSDELLAGEEVQRLQTTRERTARVVVDETVDPRRDANGVARRTLRQKWTDRIGPEIIEGDVRNQDCEKIVAGRSEEVD
jgi:hypothetical protein